MANEEAIHDLPRTSYLFVLWFKNGWLILMKTGTYSYTNNKLYIVCLFVYMFYNNSGMWLYYMIIVNLMVTYLKLKLCHYLRISLVAKLICFEWVQDLFHVCVRMKICMCFKKNHNLLLTHSKSCHSVYRHYQGPL